MIPPIIHYSTTRNLGHQQTRIASAVFFLVMSTSYVIKPYYVANCEHTCSGTAGLAHRLHFLFLFLINLLSHERGVLFGWNGRRHRSSGTNETLAPSYKAFMK